MNSCERFERLISLAVDGEATPEEQARLERHLASCPDCRAYYADIRRIHQAFIREDMEVPEGFSERLMDRVRETKQDPVRDGGKKTVRFPRWRRWGTLAACCALTALCVWCVWEAGGRNIVTKDDKSMESLDMRSMDSGFRAARSTDSADLTADEDIELVPMDLDDEAPQPIADKSAAMTKSAAEADAGGGEDQLLPNSQPAGSAPEEDGEADGTGSYYRMDRDDGPYEEVGVFFTEDEAEREAGAEKATEVPPAVPVYTEEPASADLPSEVADVPEPGIVTAFGSAAQSWVEDVLGAPWAGGGSYPLTAEQYGDLLRTLDEAGEPYRVEPGGGYCLLTG